MSTPTFTVLLPVLRPPLMMPFAIESVQRQTRSDFELFIICDGAPEETVAAAKAAATLDPRIRVFPFAKGERNGEQHRHLALAEARGRYVCQIADDDLWFPEHLAEIERLLKDVEFGNLLHAYITAADEPRVRLADLADAAVQQQMLKTRWNVFGPTVSGYRMETYRRMPVGWAPAPPDLWSDLYMWRKFLALDGVVVGTRFVVSAVSLPSPERSEWTMERRREENQRYAQLIQDSEFRRDLAQRALRYPARGLTKLSGELERFSTKLSHISQRAASLRRWP